MKRICLGVPVTRATMEPSFEPMIERLSCDPGSVVLSAGLFDHSPAGRDVLMAHMKLNSKSSTISREPGRISNLSHLWSVAAGRGQPRSPRIVIEEIDALLEAEDARSPIDRAVMLCCGSPYINDGLARWWMSKHGAEVIDAKSAVRISADAMVDRLAGIVDNPVIQLRNFVWDFRMGLYPIVRDGALMVLCCLQKGYEVGPRNMMEEALDTLSSHFVDDDIVLTASVGADATDVRLMAFGEARASSAELSTYADPLTFGFIRRPR